jgi:hypothetical protein
VECASLKVEKKMDRRDFIERALIAGGSLCWNSTEGFSQNINYPPIAGADPSGLRDSTSAFRELIRRLPAKDARLIIPAGTYLFSPSKEPIFHFKNFDGLAIEGNDVLLVFEHETSPFHFEDCQNITISGVSVDWKRPPFSQGQIQDTGDKWFVVELDSGFSLTGLEHIGAIGEYDTKLQLPARDGLDQYGGVKAVIPLTQNSIRVEVSAPVDLQKGATVLLRHPVYGINIFVLNRCSSVRFNNVTLHAAPGMGILAGACSELEFTGVRVVPTPKSNRLLSLNADAVHLTDCSGAITFSGCEFRGMGDDAINIYSRFFLITGFSQSKSTARIQVQDRSSRPFADWQRSAEPLADWELPPPGAMVEICNPDTLAPQGSANVLSRSARGTVGTLEVELGDMRSGGLQGLILCSSRKESSTVVHDCRFDGNRARAILVHNNAKIYRSRFFGQSLPAILLSADSGWMEGPAVRDIEIFENDFAFNNYGKAAFRRGAVTVDTSADAHEMVLPSGRVNANVSIHDNRFSGSCGYDIYAVRTSGLSIERNSFRNSGQMLDAARAKEAVFLNAVDCSRFEDNKFETGVSE